MPLNSCRPFGSQFLSLPTALFSQMLHWQEEQLAHLSPSGEELLPNGQRMGSEQPASPSTPQRGYSDRAGVNGVGGIGSRLSEVPECLPFWATHSLPLFPLSFSPYPFSLTLLKLQYTWVGKAKGAETVKLWSFFFDMLYTKPIAFTPKPTPLP